MDFANLCHFFIVIILIQIHHVGEAMNGFDFELGSVFCSHLSFRFPYSIQERVCVCERERERERERVRKREQKHFIIFRIVVLTQLRLRQQKISIKIVKQILFLPKVIHSIAKLIKLCLNNLFYHKNGISNETKLLFPCVA